MRETKHLAVGERTAELLRQLAQILFFVGAEGEAFTPVVFRDVVDIDDRFRLAVGLEYAAVEAVVAPLKHLVKRIVAVAGEGEFFDARDALQSHVLGDFYGVGAPRCDHFFARTDEFAFDGCGNERGGAAKQPGELFLFFVTEAMVGLNGYYFSSTFLKEYNHKVLVWMVLDDEMIMMRPRGSL